MRKFTVEGKPQRLSKYLGMVFPELRFAYFRQLLKTKNVRINERRVTEDIYVEKGDVIELFLEEERIRKFDYTCVFEDSNVLITAKPRGIAVEEYAKRICSSTGRDYRLAHRLDVNTQGLLMFAKNDDAEKALFEGFKRGFINKKYLAEVVGKEVKEGVFDAYLVKDGDKGEVKIFANKVGNSKKIRTGVTLVSQKEYTALVEVELHTGKTHQIRAHLSFLGMPIVGDTKYGDFEMNKELRAKRQLLTAYKLSFKFPISSKLNYLNEKEFGIKPDFC